MTAVGGSEVQEPTVSPPVDPAAAAPETIGERASAHSS